MVIIQLTEGGFTIPCGFTRPMGLLQWVRNKRVRGAAQLG